MSCGCKFKQFGTRAKDCDGLPPIEIDYSNLRDCAKTWALLSTGNTKGVFQLEKNLGQHWCKEVQPWNLEELAALTALLRPGCLNSFIEDKSITQHYADRKNGVEEAIPFHPALEEILKGTHQVITYQEQVMRIANEIAGYTLGEADVLRKAIGKKDAKLMQSLKKSFIDGCVKVGHINEKTASELFDMIESSNRYLFNACLSLDTLVETEDGKKTIDEIKIGDMVNSPDGFIEVVNVHDNGLQEIYEITLESGKTIKCTLDHKFLCENGEILPLYEILYRKYSIVTI